MPEDFDAPLFASQAPSQPPDASSSSTVPVDQSERDSAILVDRSVLVQAPAGSGKTDLLTRRFLALLADAPIENPGQILAITFTRAATAEMRNRILADLHKAAASAVSAQDDERMQLAHRALARAQKAGWRILEQPELLQIETIDSLCLRIVQSQPLIARLGGRIDPVEDARPLYLEAARRTIRNLGGDNQDIHAAIEHLLNLRDNHLADCEMLLAEMLEHRDQWEDIFPDPINTDWDTVRSTLEKPFRDAVSNTLTQARELLLRKPLITEELMCIADYASQHRDDGALALLAKTTVLPPASSLEHWLAISNFLLKKTDGDWYAKFTKANGLPAGKAGSEEKDWNQRGNQLLERLRTMPDLLEALRAIRTLPNPRYDDDQWITLRYLFSALRRSLGELRVLFAERNQIDFLYSSGAALEVLRNDASGFSWANGIRHLLVDEFQDTSRRQHELISTLISHWSGDQSRSAFVVGDPMQSIYLFREAEVELFHLVRKYGIRHENNFSFPLEPLTLSVNFRSHARLIHPLNGIFKPVFDADISPGASPVQFTHSQAHTAAMETIHQPPFQVYPQLLDARDKMLTSTRKHDLRHCEAERVAKIITAHQHRIDEARQNKREYRVAVLVRNRNHLAVIAPLLRRRGIAFRAVEIESLSERQELLDLMSLVRALLLPMDRIAWLSVLRTPWCGLTLADLHQLTGSDTSAARRQPMLPLIEQNLQVLDPDSRQRAERSINVLLRALAARPHQSQTGSFAEWIERTWRALGGHLCLNATELENVEVFFSLLDGVSPDGSEVFASEFQRRIDNLYAQPDPSVSESCGVQLMTIHKAKGLGFDVVIVPALERATRPEDSPLIASLQRTHPRTGNPEFLIAPIGQKGGDKHPIYKWIQKQRSDRYAEERKRLFYVACTRARQELHLIGTASYSDKGLAMPRPGSLLRTAWPALHTYFESALTQQPHTSSAHTTAEIIPFPAPAQPGVLTEIAAQVDAFPHFRRLRLDADISSHTRNVAMTAATPEAEQSQGREFHRPQGSRLARVIGSTLHLLLQRLGAQIVDGSIDEAILHRQIIALLRGSALDTAQSLTALKELQQMISACQADPIARWILADHPGAQSEASWTGWLDGSLRTLRADRIFRAGPEPLAPAQPEYLWIIDYKTSDTAADDTETFLAQQRNIYSPQLAAYAHIARGTFEAGTALPIRLGTYYPRLIGNVKFDWWEG